MVCILHTPEEDHTILNGVYNKPGAATVCRSFFFLYLTTFNPAPAYLDERTLQTLPEHCMSRVIDVWCVDIS